MSDIQSIRQSIRDLRVKNKESKFFVPQGALNSCLTHEAVRSALKSAEVEKWREDELACTIMLGARKVFAILVIEQLEKRITDFVEHDLFLGRELDSLIPLSRETLQSILSDRAAVELFEERQWEFAAPIFREQLSHRYFGSDARLPFTQKRNLDSGGFGQVYEVALPAGHHDFEGICANETLLLALKELKVLEPEASNTQTAAESWSSTGGNEHMVLSHLHHFKHPSITPLLASYTYQGTHFLLFPLAPGGNLEKFLTSSERPREFQEHASFPIALSGLASALETLHSYKSAAYRLEMIGYHHDLKPQNILVSGQKFVLSDFGLSKLKVADDSRTPFKDREDFYLAPECEDIQRDFAKGVVTRASDVWSFGAVMLELIIFMVHGTDKLREFREARRYKSGTHFTRTFYRETGLNPPVEDMIRDLKRSESVTIRKLVRVVESALMIAKEERIKAGELSSRLRYISVEATFFPVVEKFEQLVTSQSPFDINIELEKFRAWAHALNLGREDSESNSEMDATFSSGTETARLLEVMGELRTQLSSPSSLQNAGVPFVFKLREANEELIRPLNDSMLWKIQTFLETRLLSKSPLSKLQGQEALEQSPLLVDIGHIAAMKRMHALSMEDSTPPGGELKILNDQLRDRQNFQACQTAVLFRSPGEPTTPVLIEWVRYGPHWTGDTGDVLFNRVGSIAAFLRSASITESETNRLRTFPCLGYFHEAPKSAFGLIYELPSQMRNHGSDGGSLCSLQTMIVEGKDINKRPLLGDIFTLAERLATTLFELHRIGWLHKNFSSYNVVFAGLQTQARKRSVLDDFRIIGFNFSRKGSPNEYTEGPWQKAAENRRYQHPEYLLGTKRYQQSFDYYSLGIVLLELGLWRPLEKMSLPKDEDSEAPKDTERHTDSRGLPTSTKYLIRNVVPGLGHRMGKRYQDVVNRCLNGDICLGGSEKDEGTEQRETLLAFDHNVVLELQKCGVDTPASHAT